MTPDTNSQQAALLLARIERLPISAWHVKACLVMGAATFFDALDVLSIAYVLPVLVGAWKLTPQQIGLLISAGFVGQIGGALLFGALAGRIGRLRAAAYAMGLFSVMSFFAAASWSVSALVVFRTIQGIGLGGEVPIAAAYINEVLTAKKRGRTFLLYQLIFPLGLVGASLVGFWLVPRFGWRSMFLIGGAPALLAVFVQRILPESPRWLVSKGRMDEAELVVVSMERAVSRNGAVSLPPVSAIEISSQPPQQTAWTELFRGIYRRRTLIVWGLWISTYFVTYGINTWLPTIYRTVYKLSVADALWNGVLTNIAGVAGAFLCAMAVDRLGRKPWFIAAFLLGGVPLCVLCLFGAKSPGPVILLASTSFLFITSNSMLVYLYTPEIYPTRLRTLGTGAASAWLRVASAAGPLVVGPILASYGVAGVFLLFGLIAVSGVGFALGVTETRGRRLEDISP